MSLDKEIKRFHPSKQEQAIRMYASRPDGAIVAKFHGEPVYLPEIEPGEPMVGKSRFSQRQYETLLSYEAVRRMCND